MDRRRFINQLGLTALGIGMGVGSWNARADGPANLGGIAYQLSWIKNFQFAGSYIADTRKYYESNGLAVNLLAGGPSLNVDPIVAASRALVGQSGPDFMCNAIAKGAPLKCIGANYQRTAICIISMAKTPLQVPRDMVGKRIGIQTNNTVIWHAFLKLNKIDPASLTTVPVQFDFTPLLSGDVDGFFGLAHDDLVQIREKGHDVHAFLFADYGYKMLNATYSVLTDSLADKTKRAQLVAFLRGEIRGWQDAVNDPDLSAKLTVDVYGAGNGLDFKSQKASCVASNEFIVGADTQKHGLFWMTPESVSETITTLGAAGIKATPDMFTNEILQEAYQGKTIL